MELHNDIRRALFFRGIWRIMRPVMWYGFFVFIVLYYVVFGKYDIRFTHIPVYIALCGIIIVPFSLDWIKEARCTFFFEGTVERIEKTRELALSVTGRYEGDKTQTPVIHFVIRDKNGRLKNFSVKNPSFFDIGYIKEGDRVIHRFGSNFLEKAIKDGDRDVLCIICGTMSRRECEICYECRHSLSKQSFYNSLNT